MFERSNLRLLTHVGFFSKTWSDTFRSVLIYRKEQESGKIFRNRAKRFIFFRRFDRKNTFFQILRNLIKVIFN